MSLCGLEFEYSRDSSNKGNLMCFGKSQQGFTLACSRLALEVCCVAFVKARVTWVLEASGRVIVWVRPCNALKNCNELKRARRKTGTE